MQVILAIRRLHGLHVEVTAAGADDSISEESKLKGWPTIIEFLVLVESWQAPFSFLSLLHDVTKVKGLD